MRKQSKPYDYSDPRPPSRSQKKRDSAAAQVLGGKVAELPESALKRLALPPDLALAIHDYKAMTGHEAKRRQLQYIGALMRETDTEPLARAVTEAEAGSKGQAREFRAVEALRDALTAGDESGLEDILAAAPEAERNELRSRVRTLARNARAEAEKNKPPRSGRALFRLLRDLRETAPVAPAAGSEGEAGGLDETDAAGDDGPEPSARVTF